MRCFEPIPALFKHPRSEKHRMVTIGRIPRVVNSFLRPHRTAFSRPAWPHFWKMVTAIAIATEHTVERLNSLLRRAVVRHLRLVDCAYACLTHLGMDAQRAQGQRKNKNMLPTHPKQPCAHSPARGSTDAELRLPPMRQLKNDLRQAIWNEAVRDVVKVSHERTAIRRLEKLLAA